VVGSLLYEEAFPSHPLGREVLGTAESVMAMERDDIVEFHDRWYRSPNLVWQPPATWTTPCWSIRF
jgi:predicted Zn-dependent peptidase